MVRWLIRLASVFLTLAVIGGFMAAMGWKAFTDPGPLISDTTVVIPAGTGLEGIARRLADSGVISDPNIFVYATRVSRQGRALKAGEFLFPAGVSQQDALAIMVSGKTVVRRVTVAEGLTSRQIIDALNAAEGLVGTLDVVPAEGSLLPETYHFSLGIPRADILARMKAAMAGSLERLWAGRADDLPIKTKDEAVILASIVEKETGVATERPLVAGVFVNRLRRGMRLQSDPTVAYGVAGGAGLGRPLTRADLRGETPYNTYVIDALPPGPIANPGEASLAAVLNPAETDFLYFVADGTGGHAFAKTLAEHNRNVRAWRKIERQRN